MKEILYKAKTKVISGDAYNGGKADGEWVKGFVYDDIGCWKIKQFDFDYCDYLEYEVDPDTISQYININDRNKEKIFENDVIHVITKNGADFNGCVIYMNGKYAIIDGTLNNFSNIITELHSNLVELEKVGNIFDNPELVPNFELKKEDNSKGVIEWNRS